MANSFHYAFKVSDLQSTRKFYGDILGCKEGRSSEDWVDFNFFGNQISAHIGPQNSTLDYCGNVDGISVPIPHFGCILTQEQFKTIQHSLDSAGIKFIIKPQVRYENKVSEQQTMFVLDLSGNPLEFKSFKNENAIY